MKAEARLRRNPSSSLRDEGRKPARNVALRNSVPPSLLYCQINERRLSTVGERSAGAPIRSTEGEEKRGEEVATARRSTDGWHWFIHRRKRAPSDRKREEEQDVRSGENSREGRTQMHRPTIRRRTCVTCVRSDCMHRVKCAALSAWHDACIYTNKTANAEISLIPTPCAVDCVFTHTQYELVNDIQRHLQLVSEHEIVPFLRLSHTIRFVVEV